MFLVTQKIWALVKNRTSHGSLGSQQTTDACDTSLKTAIKCRLVIQFPTLYPNRLKS